MLWSTTGRQLIKVTLLTSASCSPESPIVRQGSSQACILITAMPPRHSTLSHILNCAFSLQPARHIPFSLLIFNSWSAFAPSLPSPPHCAGFMSVLSTSSYLSTTWVHQTLSQASSLSHTAEVYDASCVCDIWARQRLFYFPVLWMSVIWVTFSQE